ncbi:MAG: NAD(P)-binding domain-containing protein [Polyangiaceae bacterium]
MSPGAIGIVGGGPWGVALARTAVRTGASVTLHTRRTSSVGADGRTLSLKDSRLIHVTTDYAEVAKNRLIVVAVPSNVAREVARALGDHLDGSHLVVHGVRGLAIGDLKTISDILREETPARRLGALGGPVQADELHHGTASALVVGSHYPEVTQAISAAMSGPWLRVYTTHDLRGLEWASAMVGCVSIGIGFAKAAGAGPGLLAALISRAVHDAGRLAVVAGAEEQTMYGLGGYGDLLASIALEQRPEVVLGRALGLGKSLEEAKKEAALRIEAVDLIPRVCAFARSHGVAAPAFEGIARMLEGHRGEEILGKFFAA